MLEVGSVAPDFSLEDQNGRVHSLSEYRGKKVVLYFYPKDLTAGCSKEAVGFGELYEEFKKRGIEIIGISKDSVKSHKKFSDKYSLPFPLLSDEEIKTVKDYEVWQEKKMYGKTFFGIVRSTYVINEEGLIEKVFDKVKADKHPKEVLESL